MKLAMRPPASSRLSELCAEIQDALEPELPRLRDLFTSWDKDKDGELDRKEFVRGINAVGVAATKEELHQLFDQWDTNTSGKLDLAEVMTALRRAQLRRQNSIETIQKAMRERTSRQDVQSKPAAETSSGGGSSNSSSESAVASALASAPAASAVVPATISDQSSKKASSLRPIGQALLAVQTPPTAKGGGAGASSSSKGGPPRRIQRRNLEECTSEAEEHDWTASQWLQSLMLHEVLISAFELPPAGAKQFNFVKRLTRQDLEEKLLRQDVLVALVDAVHEGVMKLSGGAGGPQDGTIKSDKFQTNAKFQMSYGSLSLFYGGLESLLGPPKMVRGSLFNAMEGEHTAEKDSFIMFTTPNGVTTQSATEWEVVSAPSRGTTYPEREGFRDRHPELCRRLRSLDDYMAIMEVECNQKLRKAGHSELIKEELCGGRLYTGPMYAKYNTVLRAKSRDKYLVELAASLTLGNDYVTTIHACNSCVLKLSKLTKAGKVWRGIKGAKLPKTFWVANDMGVRGGIEYGFSSTSTDKAQAFEYATGGDRQEGDASTIFEMQMGMVDRGADLTWLSQYPHEREVLLPPLTGLEALEHSVEGGVLVIQSRFSLNMAAHTLEQVLSRRRKMLMDMCLGIELELRDQLDERLGTLAIKILNLSLQFGPFAKPTEWFNDDENFAQVMSSTLRLQHVLQSEIGKLASHMEKPDISFRGWRELADSRTWLIAGWANARTSQSEVSVDLREACLTDAEGVVLAECLQKCPRLTSLDLRGNPALKDAGLAALCQALRDEKPGHPRSLCGVSPGNTRLEVQRQFGPEEMVDLQLIVAELENHIYSESVTAGMGGKATSGTIQLNRRGGGGKKEDGASGWQPLMWAARACHVQIAQQLLRNGANVNEQEAAGSHSNKYSPLHMACYKGHSEMARLLLRCGADLTLKDVNGQTARTVAEKKAHTELVELLDAHAASPLPPLLGGGAQVAIQSQSGGTASVTKSMAPPPVAKRQPIGGGAGAGAMSGRSGSLAPKGAQESNRGAPLTPKSDGGLSPQVLTPKGSQESDGGAPLISNEAQESTSSHAPTPPTPHGQVARTVAEKKAHTELVELLDAHAASPLPPLLGGGAQVAIQSQSGGTASVTKSMAPPPVAKRQPIGGGAGAGAMSGRSGSLAPKGAQESNRGAPLTPKSDGGLSPQVLTPKGSQESDGGAPLISNEAQESTSSHSPTPPPPRAM